MSTVDDRANELIERYLERGASTDQRDDPARRVAWKLGTAIAMLGSLLDLYENADPATTRRMFMRWLAEQRPAAAPDLLELAKQYASECDECNGTGYLGRNAEPAAAPCPNCADIRAVIAKAESAS